MSNNIWRNTPLQIVVLAILESRRGVMLYTDLSRLLEKKGNAISECEINKTLMQLEIKGEIHVTNINRNQKKIERVREGQAWESPQWS